MIHYMALTKSNFDAIQDGTKVIEVRLYDEKRRRISVGDNIEFNCLYSERSIVVAVLQLAIFPTFQQMYEALPFTDIGCDGWSMDDMLSGTYAMYTPEQEKHWGTLAITIGVK